MPQPISSKEAKIPLHDFELLVLNSQGQQACHLWQMTIIKYRFLELENAS